MLYCGFGGLEVACWPLVLKFAGSNPAEAVGFFTQKNPQHAFFRRGSKAVGPNVVNLRHVKEPKTDVEVATFSKILVSFSHIVPPSLLGLARVVSGVGDTWWRWNVLIAGPPSWGFDMPLATALCS